MDIISFIKNNEITNESALLSLLAANKIEYNKILLPITNSEDIEQNDFIYVLYLKTGVYILESTLSDISKFRRWIKNIFDIRKYFEIDNSEIKEKYYLGTSSYEKYTNIIKNGIIFKKNNDVTLLTSNLGETRLRHKYVFEVDIKRLKNNNNKINLIVIDGQDTAQLYKMFYETIKNKKANIQTDNKIIVNYNIPPGYIRVEENHELER